jgi:hypothetical protein
MADLATDRLAFGAVMALPVNGPQEAYKILSNYLNFDLDPEASDFYYQINRRRPSKTLSDVQINRLMRWGVGVFRQGELTISFYGSSTRETGPAHYFLRPDLDINTAPEARGLPVSELGSLLDEMVQLSLEIIREGDIP